MATFIHTFPRVLALCASLTLAAGARSAELDLLAAGKAAWRSPVAANWQFDHGAIRGRTTLLDGAKSDPAASLFLVSRQIFSGDYSVEVELRFHAGRYFGIYLDYAPETDTGIWMATGHALADDAAENEIERAYIKTVDDGFWVVRTSGELAVTPGQRLALRFERRGNNYSLWHDGRMIIHYDKPGGYPPGPIKLRLTNADASIDRLLVRGPESAPQITDKTSK